MAGFNQEEHGYSGVQNGVVSHKAQGGGGLEERVSPCNVSEQNGIDIIMNSLAASGYPTVKFPSGKVYDGDLSQEHVCSPNTHVTDGAGSKSWLVGPFAGDRYEGEWQGGKFHGHGCYTFANGDRYEGGYLNGRCHGNGLFKWTNGSIYEGEYRSGKKSGTGTESNAFGHYSGQWWANFIHGQGRWEWKDGTVYKGEFFHNRPTRGVLKENNGQRFEVEFAHDCAMIHAKSELKILRKVPTHSRASYEKNARKKS